MKYAPIIIAAIVTVTAFGVIATTTPQAVADSPADGLTHSQLAQAIRSLEDRVDSLERSQTALQVENQELREGCSSLFAMAKSNSKLHGSMFLDILPTVAKNPASADVIANKLRPHIKEMLRKFESTEGGIR